MSKSGRAPQLPKNPKPGSFTNPTKQRSPFGLGYNKSGTPRKPSGSGGGGHGRQRRDARGRFA